MSFEVDGVTPDVVLRPQSLDELAAQLSALGRRRESAIPWGGGTRMHVGNLPASYDAAIDLTGLPMSIEHVAGDMVCVAAGNVSIAALRTELAKSGQRLPFDVPGESLATVGGSLASNAPGRTRSSLGGIRDWVIGIKVMLPDGTITKSGGRVVKNVQGFDLHRLHTGAYGTLGIIVEAAFKLVPIPSSESTVAAWFENLTGARDYSMSLFNGSFAPESLTMVTGDPALKLSAAFAAEVGLEGSGYLVLARMTGIEAAVERMTADTTGLAGTTGSLGYLRLEEGTAMEAWNSINDAEVPGAIELRLALRPAEALTLIDAAEKLARNVHGASCSALVDVGFGGVRLSLDTTDEVSISELLDSVSKLIDSKVHPYVVERLPAALKPTRDVFSLDSANMGVMKRLKTEFDPHGTLNRGRFAGGI